MVRVPVLTRPLGIQPREEAVIVKQDWGARWRVKTNRLMGGNCKS